MGRVVLGMIGLGTVGTGVVRLLAQHGRLALKKVAVKDPGKARQLLPACPITGNALEVIDDPEIEIVIEVMGGEKPALDYLTQAIERRKHVVTANKEVLAKHGPDLFNLARQKGVTIFFEASVAGGVPLISTMHKGLGANTIHSVAGILNGTTNFILSQMEHNNASFDAALKEAQLLGFAEADPTNDVDGHDVSYKLSILSALSFGKFARPEHIFKEGIRNISTEDIAQAKELGMRVKLVGTAERAHDGRFAVRVHPTLVPAEHPLASVSGSNNGILVEGDAVGQIVMVGPGAGELPTASAVVGDTINLASALQLPDFASYFHPAISSEWASVADAGEWKSPFYLRLSVADMPGVIGRIGTIFAEHNISIQSIIQRGVHDTGATIVILTHSVVNSNMDKALADISKCDFLDKIASCIRLYQAPPKNA